MKHRFISAAAAAVTAFSVCSTAMTAFAKEQSGTVDGYFTWTLTDGEIMNCVSVFEPTFNINIDISGDSYDCFVDGTEINDKFMNFDNLTSLAIKNPVFSNWILISVGGLDTLTLSDNITKFNASLNVKGTEFLFNTISELNLGKNIKTIGNEFLPNAALEELVLPASLESVGKNAFLNNADLKNIYVYSEKLDLSGTGIGILKDGSKMSGVTIHGYAGSPAESYAKANGFKFDAFPKNDDSNNNNTSKFHIGDVTRDGAVDAVDASSVLTAYANTATQKPSGLDAEQAALADVNKDGAIDAIDASTILSYYAFIATGGSGSFEDYLNK